MTTITVLRPTTVRVPRVAGLAATLFVHLLSWFERSGQARADARLASSRASEAAAVRAYAHQHSGLDPRFAADLLAAADRHERAE